MSVNPSKPQLTSQSSFKMPDRIAVLYSEVKREYFATEQLYITEKDADVSAESVAKYLRELNIEVQTFPGDLNLAANLTKFSPQMVFNLVESIRGDDTLVPSTPGLLELLNIPYTGTGILGLALTMNKYLVYKLLQQKGVPVPHHQLFINANDPLDTTLRFPLITKLNNLHGSMEMQDSSICETERQLRDKLKFLISTYKQAVLVDEFIAGKEIHVVLLEGKNTKVYSAERIFDESYKNETYKYISYENKWKTYESTVFLKYENERLQDYAKIAFETLMMSDYAKFDVRLDSAGRYYFIDSNANPFFGPPEIHSCTSIIAELHGVTFSEFLKRLIVNTLDIECKTRQG